MGKDIDEKEIKKLEEEKNKLKEMSYDEKLKILSSDGMLVKRPILICSNNILIGFKQKEWEEI